MRKKGWKKRAASIALAAAMVVSSLAISPFVETEIAQAATEESWSNTTLVTNGDFEASATAPEGWTITEGTGVCKIKKESAETAKNQTQMLNIYSGTSKSFSVQQEISNVPAGTYRLVFEQDGMENTASGLSVSVNGLSSELAATTGWDQWTTVTTDEFTLTEAGTVTIMVSGTIAAGYWGDFDNFVLQKCEESTEGGDLPDVGNTVNCFIDDFNDGDTEGWISEWSVSNATFRATDDGTPFGSKGLNIYSGSAQKLTASYTVSNLEAGTYDISMKNAGEVSGASVTVSGDGVEETTKELTFGAWEAPETNKTSSFTVSKTTDLIIKIEVDFQAGNWGWIDDVEVTKSEKEPVEGDVYDVSIAASTDSVEVGNPVILTATVTKNGVKVTNLEEAGLHLYWWDNTNNSDAWFVDYESTNGYALSLQVQPQKAGTYEIQAKLQDKDWKDLNVQKFEMKVEEASTAVEGDLNITKVKDLPADFIMGMDISSIIAEFDSGVTFKDYDGNVIDNVTDFCKFLASNGITHIRVRVWNDPYTADGKGYGGGNNDVAKAKLIADACREAGIKMLVDFHCSDLWTDPGKQQAPKAWKGYTVAEKAEALTAFLKDSLNTIDPKKDTVAMVQVGNETTSGFIGETKVADMCTLFSAGAAGVRAYNEAVKVVIHVTNPEKGNVTKWAKNLDDNNVNYDILATSYYPYWHGTLDNLKSELAKVRSTYGKDVMVAETSYAYTLNDSDGHDNTVRVGNNDKGDNIKQPFTEQGQATAIRDVIETVNEAGGLGVFYWESAWITVGDTTGLTGDAYDKQVEANKATWEKFGSGWASSYASEYDAKDAGKWYGGTAVDNEAMFYPDGTPTPGLHVWNYVKTGAINKEVAIDSVGTSAQQSQTIKIGESHTLPETITISYTSGAVDEPVVWNESEVSAIKPDQAGTYKVSGTVTFSKKVTQGTYKGKTSVDVEFVLTVLPKNLLTVEDDIEFNSGENFTVTGSGLKGIPSTADPYSGKNCMGWWNATATSAAVTYNKEITLEKGDYVFETVSQGADSAVTLQVLDTDEKVLFGGEAEALSGWNIWHTPKVEISLNAQTTVKLRISIEMADGGWGSLDCLYLHEAAKTSGGDTPDTPDTPSDSGSTSSGGSSSASTPSTNKPVVTDNPDGTKTETKTETVKNESGKEVEVTVKTNKDKDGNVIGSSEVSVIAKADDKTSATVTVAKDEKGKVTEAVAEVATAGTESKKGVAGSIAGSVISQITEAAGTKSVEINISVNGADGKEAYTLKADSAELKAGNKLKVLAIDPKTGAYVIVNATTYKVAKTGDVKVTLPGGKDYELVTAKEAAAAEKAVLNTVKVKKSSATVKAGKTTTVKMSSKLNMANVAKITYTTGKKSVATVSKNGKVTAKKAGTVIIKAKVTLNNGKTKTVSMKIKVK